MIDHEDANFAQKWESVLNLNDDFSKPALVHAAQVDWIASPMPGVERRMLDRIGDEVARATSLVRYAVGSSFSAHTHDLGEEFLVLEGVFQDEHGDFPAGSYVRNPPTSSHTPRSDEGCVIFVKLRQFDSNDRVHVLKRSDEMIYSKSRHGSQVVLHQDEREKVTLEKFAGGSEIVFDDEGPIELFCVKGVASFQEVTIAKQTLEKHSWLRVPNADGLKLSVVDDSTFWIKRGPFMGLP